MPTQCIYQPIVVTPTYVVAVRIAFDFDDWDALNYRPFEADFTDYKDGRDPYPNPWDDDNAVEFGCHYDADLPESLSDVLEAFRDGKSFPSSVVYGCAVPGLLTADELLDLTLRAGRSTVSTWFFPAESAAKVIEQVREFGTFGDAEFRQVELWTRPEPPAPVPVPVQRTQPRRLSKSQRQAA